MKRLLTILCVLLFFTAMLIFPKETFQGASSGVLLWFHTVLPTLLPFLIISNLLIHTGAINLISRLLAPILCRFFRVSPYGAFVILIGFLCGCPMGSKVTADLLKKEAICEKEARYLLSFCNNTSPMFIVSYILWQNLNIPELTLPLLTLLTAAPVLLSFVFRRLYHIPVQGVYITSQDTLSVNGRDSLDTCIMNGFETITRIGGYIILFSILFSFAELIIAKSVAVTALLLPTLEITTGITMICSSPLSLNSQIILALALTSFGGWCAAAQTRAMIMDTSLPLGPYIAEKLITALVTSLLAWCFLSFR
ncbi:nucleoside recognition domain-containing protein [Sporofaciens musculi]|uniref:nucleoside recognition domain-containing protein n=1 Tax=Sporofaciens musculi TaxID=2681861 RepID=UPI002585D8B6|nr:nucleoside recognition domain-containing protein [Sporofaciens musculi]